MAIDLCPDVEEKLLLALVDHIQDMNEISVISSAFLSCVHCQFFETFLFIYVFWNVTDSQQLFKKNICIYCVIESHISGKILTAHNLSTNLVINYFNCFS